MTDPFNAGRATPPQRAAHPHMPPSNAYAPRAAPAGERDANAPIVKAPPPHAFDGAGALGGGLWRRADHRRQCGARDRTRPRAGSMAASVGADYRLSPDTRGRLRARRRRTNFNVAWRLRPSDLFQAGAFGVTIAGAYYLRRAGLCLAGRHHRRSVAASTSCATTSTPKLGRAASRPASLRTPSIAACTPYAAGQFTTFSLPDYAESELSGANTSRLTYGEQDVTACAANSACAPTVSATLDCDPDPARPGRLGATSTPTAARRELPSCRARASWSTARRRPAKLPSPPPPRRWGLNGFSLAATFEGEFAKRPAASPARESSAMCW